MAERPVWRGHLRLALVSCPIALFTAKTERSNLHFHFINPDTGHRVRMVTQDAETGAELSRGDLVKGYEFKKDNYLLLSNEDFEAARIESSATINVDKFIPVGAIDPVYFENSYFLVPDGTTGSDVYVVLREAIIRSKRVALSRVVIARRERAVVIMPMEQGLIAHTLAEHQDINNPQALFDTIPSGKPDNEMVQLATQLIDRQSEDFDPADMTDRYEARLREVIEAKLKGEGFDAEPEEPEDGGNVIDLMAALKKSLQGPAPAEAPPKPTRAPAPAREAAKKPAAAKKAPSPKAAEPAKKAPARKRA